ncbi:tRNA (adenosine(37)-N6)-threonylcarbamoyltransferase complex dimerization subunit type 1 TsaB [Borrelia turcica IST7]|uniref:tRNA (Adenosine(37)-N6)-threonylcarbamoyltransferase complex dimerization subunit type 1 TsaB n=1 Tax=Borrelia turcica IST7 TaxID=1104446 RepID=A0A386PMA2_9SPIR|nr:tRNA (adenosine(37)-N6)-threonylcarbamoyltransferase complex dimerization subunit type 1 TsaB [Borrelia turcica]AYE36073.1 tRNA (adenosine(37)-N6)-threonylcarbamoyltransferase complex dimerization subunit type 1 TsaB [Borrelia turcica IST7]
MNTLAVDYSYKSLLVYFKINDEVLSLVVNKDRVNNNLSVPKIFKDFVLENNINLNHLDLIINSYGPGSFTGLRISLSFIKGLSLGLSIPFVNILTFDVFANLVHQNSDIVTLSFTAGRYFFGYYRCSKLCDEVFCFSEEELFEYLGKLDSNLVIIGNGIEFVYEKLKNKYNVISNMDSFGEVLTELGKCKYLKNKKGDDILSGPFYARRSDAEINSYLIK